MAEQITTPTPEGNPGTDGAPAPTEKTFTQAEVDSLISERLNRDRRTRESDPDFKAFKEWQKTQKTEAEKQAEREREHTAALNELAALKAEKKVLAANAKPEFAEFVASKILAMGEDFEKNLSDYKKNNPQYFGEAVVKKVASAPKLDGQGAAPTTNSKMNDLIRGIRN